MFASAHIYLNALFLLLGDGSERSASLVREFLDIVDKQSTSKEIMTTDDELIGVYRWLIKSVLAEKITQENETASKMLLLKLSSNETIKNHPVQKDLLIEVLTAKLIISAEQIDEYMKSLRNMVLASAMNADIRKAYAQTRSLTDIEDVEAQTKQIIELKRSLETTLKNIEHRERQEQAKASESFVSMSDEESLKRSMTKFMERSVTGVIRTGLQGLNKALGERGGIGRGESAVFVAPSHHYKSGILISIMIWTIIYNSFVVKPGKRAMVWFVSLENEVHENIMFVFRAIYTRTYKKKVDVGSMTVDEMAKWLVDYFKQFNVELVIDRYTPHEFSFEKFLKRYNSFMELDLEMVLFDLDYMSEARGIDPGDSMSGEGKRQLIGENYTKFCNHAKQQGYALTTGHQLNRKATDEAARQPNAVKRFNESMIADSSEVFRSVDIIFFMLLETNIDDQKFLTMMNRKNRGNQDTPDAHKYFAYPFTQFGIEDDIGELPGFVTDINAYGLNNQDRSNVSENALY